MNHDKNNLTGKYMVKNFNNSLLLEPGSVIGVDGVLINTNTDTRVYTAETITDTEVWRIDKRPLIILISSYNQS
jgi:CRP-like cAMP-binding protein